MGVAHAVFSFSLLQHAQPLAHNLTGILIAAARN